ncbi:MAG: hypothetical protein ACTSR2_01325 [Candidatus Hodarchaeales archaeon]
MKKIYREDLKGYILTEKTDLGYEVWQSAKDRNVYVLKRVQFLYFGDTIRDGDNQHLHFELIDSIPLFKWKERRKEYITVDPEIIEKWDDGKVWGNRWYYKVKVGDKIYEFSYMCENEDGALKEAKEKYIKEAKNGFKEN